MYYLYVFRFKTYITGSSHHKILNNWTSNPN